MNEAQYTTLFKNDLLEAYPEIFWYKIPDFPFMSIVTGFKRLISSNTDAYTASRIIKSIGQTGIYSYTGQKKPFDVFAVIYGRAVAIEFKVVDSIDATLPFNILKDHQEAGLKEFATSAEYGGGCGLLGIFSRDPELIAFYDIFGWSEEVDRVGGGRKSFPKDTAARSAWAIITRNRIGQKKQFDCEKFYSKIIMAPSKTPIERPLPSQPANDDAW